jgi:excisionase family DNA binding protein
MQVISEEDTMSKSTDLGEKPHWYTIKKAAEYLDVGEPTIYRWMRDGRITFRKVGDSTRFLKEDLEAMVQVHPSPQDVDRATSFCPLCHHNELINGRVQSTGLIYFKPEKTKFWTFKDANVQTNARMCTRCGHIVNFGDVSKLGAIQVDKDDA